MSKLSRLAPLGFTALVAVPAFALAAFLPKADAGTASDSSGGASGASGASGDGHSHSHGAGAATPATGDSGVTGKEASVPTVPRKDRCDLGFNTQAFNEVAEPGFPHLHDDTAGVDFTIEEWADVFVDESKGLSKEVVVGYIEGDKVSKDGILSGSLTHSLNPDNWNPMTNKAACEELAAEIETAQATAAKYPTAADAVKAGYEMVTRYYPGIAAHYMKFDLVDGTFDLEQPEMLLYDGDLETANIAGLSYYVVKTGSNEPAVGLTGSNDHYHRHLGLCSKDGVVVAGSSTSEADCAALGGSKGNGAAGWMSHLWVVPGCESDWGLFSGANPKLSVRGVRADADQPSGCGTGKAVTDELAFERAE